MNRATERIGRIMANVRAADEARVGERQRALRQREARKALLSCPFVPAKPFRVETFSGGIIRTDYRLNVKSGNGNVTDYHVCDARGRTVFVVPYTWGKNATRKRKLARAEWYAQELNAL